MRVWVMEGPEGSGPSIFVAVSGAQSPPIAQIAAHSVSVTG
jgi:hypothetical protein